MGWPKTTYRPRDQRAANGEAVRFYCEAFVGKSFLRKRRKTRDERGRKKGEW